MIFSERLKELRESKKISMYTLAKQLGVQRCQRQGGYFFMVT